MPYSVRGNWQQDGNASGGAISLAKPTGVVSGDLIVAVLYLETDTNTWTGPSGWTLETTSANTGIFSVQLWYRIADGTEGASFTFTPAANAWRVGTLMAFQGGSGPNRFDVEGTAQGDAVLSNAQTAPSVTTTVADDLLIFGYGNFSGTNTTALTGAAATLAGSYGGTVIGYNLAITAGATGTTRPSSGPGTEDYAALHTAFKLSGGGTDFPRSLTSTILHADSVAHNAPVDPARTRVARPLYRR